ncbi:MAG: hypothetical protein ABJN69_06405 [Hellea sp.]
MTFYRAIDRIERVLDLIFHYFRKVFPKRPSWVKFSGLCITLGTGILSSPFWLPFAAAIFGVVIEEFGHVQADAPLLLSPELYGGILIISGILIFLLFGLIVGEKTKLDDFVSTSSRKDETFERFVKRVADEFSLTLEYENDVPQNVLDTELSEETIDGNDCARIIRNIANKSQCAALRDIHTVATKTKLIIGNGEKDAKSEHAASSGG